MSIGIKWLGGIVAGLLVAWIIYAGLLKPVLCPTPTTTQTGGTSNTYNIKVGFGGCARIPSK
jgi:hypothetical protein